MAAVMTSRPILRRAGVGALTLLAVVVLVWSVVPSGVAAEAPPILMVGGSKAHPDDNYVQVQEGDAGTSRAVRVTFTLSSPLETDTAFAYYYQSKGEPESSVYSTATRGEDFRIGTTNSVCSWHQRYGTMACTSVIPAGETEVAESVTVVGDDIDEGERERLEINLLPDERTAKYRLMATMAAAKQNRLGDGRPTYSGLVILIMDDDDVPAGVDGPTCTCPAPQQAREAAPAAESPNRLEAQQAREGARLRWSPPHPRVRQVGRGCPGEAGRELPRPDRQAQRVRPGRHCGPVHRPLRRQRGRRTSLRCGQAGHAGRGLPHGWTLRGACRRHMQGDCHDPAGA